MKIGQITLIALALTSGCTVFAQEKTENRVARENNISKTKVVGLPNTQQSPEQIATAKTEKLKSSTQLSSEQEVSVKNLFLKIENRKAALTNLNEQEKCWIEKKRLPFWTFIMEFPIKGSDVYGKYWINSTPEPITNFLTLGLRMKFPIPAMIFTYLPEGQEILWKGTASGIKNTIPSLTNYGNTMQMVTIPKNTFSLFAIAIRWYATILV